MNTNHIYEGHNLTILRQLDPSSIDMLLTSPPYYGLRNYNTAPQIWGGDMACDHIWETKVKKGISGGVESDKVHIKDAENFQKVEDTEYGICSKCHAWKGELGQEPTPDLFIDHLVEIFITAKRVLKPEATLWINLGDSYAGSGGAGGDWNHGKRSEASKWIPPKTDIPSKSLIGIPFRFAIKMIDAGFILRNTIIWHKPNCLPMSVTDRFTVDFEYLFLFSLHEQYYFKQQLEGIKQLNRWGGNTMSKNSPKKQQLLANMKMGKTSALREGNSITHKDSTGEYSHHRNKRTVWTIPTESFPEAHFAVFPTALCETPIDAGCPQYVCPICGKAKLFVIDRDESVPCPPIGGVNKQDGFGNGIHSGNTEMKIPTGSHWEAQCDHTDPFVPGIVLDPFFGSGTTGLVAQAQKKRFVGIELNPAYIKIAKHRLGLNYVRLETSGMSQRDKNDLIKELKLK